MVDIMLTVIALPYLFCVRRLTIPGTKPAIVNWCQILEGHNLRFLLRPSEDLNVVVGGSCDVRKKVTDSAGRPGGQVAQPVAVREAPLVPSL